MISRARAESDAFRSSAKLRMSRRTSSSTRIFTLFNNVFEFSKVSVETVLFVAGEAKIREISVCPGFPPSLLFQEHVRWLDCECAANWDETGKSRNHYC